MRWVVEGAAVYERLLRFSLLPNDTSYKFPDSVSRLVEDSGKNCASGC